MSSTPADSEARQKPSGISMFIAIFLALHIPLFIYPAATTSDTMEQTIAIASVVIAFSVATVLVMTLSVFVIQSGIRIKTYTTLSRFGHAIGGLTILVCGISVKFGF